MGCMEFRWFLDFRLVQHQYLDDIVVYGRQWSLMVAIMALRMDRLRDIGYFHLYDWTHRCNIPYTVSRR